MSSEHDFSYDPRTGECEAPKNENWDIPPNPFLQPPAQSNVLSENSPSQHAQQQVVPKSSVKARGGNRSRKDRIVTEIHQLLKKHYFKGVTSRGTQFLINWHTSLATPLEVEGLLSDIQSLALNLSGLAIAPQEVKLALGAIKGDPPDAQNLSASIGLTVLGGQGRLYLLTPEGIVEIHAQGGYRLPEQLQEPIGFVRLKNTRSPLFSVFFSQISNQPLTDFLNQLNVPKESQLLVLAWLVTGMIPNAENVLLEIVGERFSGKSTLQSALKTLIDPSLEPLIGDTPQTQAQMFELGKRNHVISLDKVDKLTPKAQEALTSLLKGKLTDISTAKSSDATQVFLSHPVILNSAESVVTWADLADRSVMVSLPRLEKIVDHFLEKPGANGAFQLAFASLVTLLSYVHASWQSVRATAAPAGMVDFYCIGVAVAEAMGGSASDFDQQLTVSLERRFEMELYEYPVAAAVRDLLGASGEESLELPVGELLQKLNDFRPDDALDSQWPRGPRDLGSKLDKCSGLMEAYGMRVGPPERKGKRGVYHRKIEKCPPQLYRSRSPF